MADPWLDLPNFKSTNNSSSQQGVVGRRTYVAVCRAALMNWQDSATAGGALLRLPGMGETLAGEKLSKLVALMAHLRGPQGCPWDREQDYDSLKGLLLEEAYEVIDAINARDSPGLA